MDKEDIWRYIYIYIHTHIMGQYSAIRKEFLPFVKTWVNFENIKLNEINQTETNALWSHLYMQSKKKIPPNN